MEYIKLGELKVSRFILGSNPFSGFSHQSIDRDTEMKRWYTTARIKETLGKAEEVGINTLIARTDYHVMRMLMEYWDEGGKLRWFAQTCPEVGEHEQCVNRAASGGAKACHIHGGVMDRALAQGELNDIQGVVDMIRENGMLAGVAGHNPKVFEWAEENIDVDYYMCSYYNPTSRAENAEHVHGAEEKFGAWDRDVMTKLIGGLSKPVVHYKILAAGRNATSEAFGYATKKMRDEDAVCVGVHTKDDADMLAVDVKMFDEGLKAARG